MFCTKCGTQLPEGENVCPKCSGAKAPAFQPENNSVVQEPITPMEININPQPIQAEQASNEPVFNEPVSANPAPEPEIPSAPSGYDANPQPQADNSANYAGANYAPNNNFGATPPYTGSSSYQNTYQTPVQNQPKQVVSTGKWLLRSLITLIPCVGGIIYLIMLFVWANDKTKEETSANWAKAQLIWIAISLGIALLGYIIFFAIAGFTFNELANELMYL